MQTQLLCLTSLLVLASPVAAQATPKKNPPRVERFLGVPRPFAPRPSTTPTAVQQETEYNASAAWADELGANTTYTGTIATATDNDLVRFTLTQDSYVLASVAGAAPTPLVDSVLFLTDAVDQFVAFSDDANGTLDPALALTLPAGIYYARVYANGGTGDYALTLTATPMTVPVVQFGQPISGTFAQLGDTVGLRVRLPVPGEVRCRVPNTGGLDLDISIHRRSGGVALTFSGTPVGPTPDFDMRLPAGDYTFNVSSATGATGTFTLDIAFVAGAIPAITCGSSTPPSVVYSNVAEFPLYEMTLATATEVDLQVVGGAVNPMTDSVMWMYDRNMTWFMYSDDVGGNLLSQRRTYLPAGTYYVGVTPTTFATLGTFVLNLSCTSPSPLASTRVGRNPGTIAAVAGTTAFAFSTPTDTPLNLRVVPTGITDGSVTILDPTGVARVFNDFATNFAGIGLPEGDYVMLVWDYFGAAGAFELDLRGSIAFQASTKGTLSLRDKVGRLLFLYATPTLLPAAIPLPTPFSGKLALDLSAFVALPPTAITGTGLLNHPVTFPDASYFVQGVLVDQALSGGAMTAVTR